MISAEILQNFPGVYWLAVVGEGASAPGVVCAGDHGLGSCGFGGDKFSGACDRGGWIA
jgi:hypothetical protein